ncbi:hypothetical protein J6590_072095 [Homalodisca vitripennis]|nr:hypothetical protein J6590_072095 [Homalodisca vitripennis]
MSNDVSLHAPSNLLWMVIQLGVPSDRGSAISPSLIVLYRPQHPEVSHVPLDDLDVSSASCRGVTKDSIIPRVQVRRYSSENCSRPCLGLSGSAGDILNVT